ncbi:phosphatase PAP2 family protein [Bacillus subtilis]|uniref:phosphatase PAP2 family protein n=1 Tax=Bacillus subtilis TaxID=1423 RepID=UPI00202A7AA0|nr:phosphatase PAP2 family protein [Bacillus subtilis]
MLIFLFVILTRRVCKLLRYLLIIVLFLIGLSRVYFNEQYLSDVAAGYAFGGVWLSLNVLVMELFRFSRRFTKLRNEPN